MQEGFPESPCDTSGLSTSTFSLYTPDSNLNLFDQSFSASLTEAAHAINASDEKEPNNFQDGPRFPPNYACFSDSKDLGNTCTDISTEEESIWEPPREISFVNGPPLPFENFGISPQIQHPTPMSAISAKESNQSPSSAGMRYSTRNRVPSIQEHSKSSEQPLFSPKLRATSNSRPSKSPNVSNSKRTPKKAHNMVEKQYRNRLNTHFASLLAKIPDELAASTGFNTAGGKSISKAETLVLAERYIKMLQTQESDLRKKNKTLEEDYERLKKAWIDSGGILMP